MKGRVLFYVLHLLGVGHLRRADILARAMAEAGLDVTIALGSKPVPEVTFSGARVVELPPVSIKNLNFSVLYDGEGRPADDAWRSARRDALLSLYREVDPDVMMFELFPFGRRQFRFELVPLLEEIHRLTPRPHVVSSVRDVLVSAPKQGRHAEYAELAGRFFDHILVHSDPTLIPFGATFSEAERIAHLLRYTGYVTMSDVDSVSSEGHSEVVVSAGGGAVGGPLLFAAMEARKDTPVANNLWRFLTGPNLPRQDFDKLAGSADNRTIVERFRKDFSARLGNAALSISQAGYNTTMDILRSHVRAVVIPYEDREETEQRLRSDILAQKGLVTIVPMAELSSARLAAAIREAVAKPPAAPIEADMSGRAATVRMISQLAARRIGAP
jgi:predicted glycosyltransferase